MKFTAPLDIHEYTVEKHAERNQSGELIPDNTITGLAKVVGETRVKCMDLAALAEALSKDASITPSVTATRLRDNALKVAEATAKRLDAAKAAAQTEIDDLTSRTIAPPQPKDQLAAGMEAEIRARLAGMDEKVRTDVIGKAFDGGDLTVIAAVLRGPAMLTGLDKTRQDMIRPRYQKQWHPQESARLARLTGALDAVDRTGRSFIGFIEKLTTNPTVALADAAANNVKLAEQAIANHTTE